VGFFIYIYIVVYEYIKLAPLAFFCIGILYIYEGGEYE
jgi:hypothetical protein